MGVLLTLVRPRRSPAGAPHIDPTLQRRLDDSAARARYWVKRIPHEAVRLLHKARLFHIAAAALSVLTGLIAWPVIADASRLTAQIVLSSLTCLIALTITAPYAIGLHDRAEEAIKLSAPYATTYAELHRAQDRHATRTSTPPPVTHLIQQLDDLTTRKDALHLTTPAREAGQASEEHTGRVR